METCTCHICGKSFRINFTGISEHLNEEGTPDFDADADHVAYSLEDEN